VFILNLVVLGYDIVLMVKLKAYCAVRHKKSLAANGGVHFVPLGTKRFHKINFHKYFYYFYIH
jgi:hypothetical protein